MRISAFIDIEHLWGRNIIHDEHTGIGVVELPYLGFKGIEKGHLVSPIMYVQTPTFLG
jgi:hypothetical protein